MNYLCPIIVRLEDQGDTRDHSSKPHCEKHQDNYELKDDLVPAGDWCLVNAGQGSDHTVTTATGLLI